MVVLPQISILHKQHTFPKIENYAVHHFYEKFPVKYPAKFLETGL